MASSSPRLLGFGVLAAMAAIAGLLTVADVRLASSQTATVVAAYTNEEIPGDDPQAAVWDSAAAVEIPLSAQTLTVPNGGGSIRTVTVRALNDGGRIYFRLEWDDVTQDMSAFASQDFRDAAAVEFPANGVSTLPSFCMGQTNAQVNIWHWKADWQADIERGFVSVPEAYPNTAVDYYPFQDDDTFYPGRAARNRLSETDRKSPVEDLVAGGFGTLTSANHQAVQGKGVWQDGKWYVMFSRQMKSAGEFHVPFKGGQTTNAAFAVWDGANGERDGLKSVSQFAQVTIEGGEGGGGSSAALVALAVLGVAAVIGLGYMIYAERFKSKG